MKRKLKKKALIVGIPAIIILILFVNPDLSIEGSDPFEDIANTVYTQIGKSYQLDFLNTHIDCREVTQLQYKVNGVWYNGPQQSFSIDDFNPLTPSTIISRFTPTGETITDFRILIQLKCTYPSWINNISVSGSYFAIIATGPLVGIDTEITTRSGTITKQNLVSGQYKNVKAYQISASEVEPFLIVHDPPYANFKAFTQSTFNFIISTAGTEQPPATSVGELGTVKSTLRVKIQDDIQPIDGGDAIGRNSPMFIDKVTRVIDGLNLKNGANTLDTGSSGGRQIFVEATLRNFGTNEGAPYLEVGGQTIVMFFVNFAEDDAKFGAYFFMARNSLEQNHNIELKAVNRPEVKATAYITVRNNVAEPFTCPTGDIVATENDCPVVMETDFKLCDDGTQISLEKQCPPGSSVVGEVAKIKINYKIFFTDGTKSIGNIEELPTFETALDTFGLVSEVEGSFKGKKLLSIHLEPFVSIKDESLQGWKITFTNLRYDLGALIGSERTSMVVLSATNFATFTGTATTNELSLGSIIINDIDQLIANTDFAKELASDEQQPLTINIKIDGEFRMVRNNIDTFQGLTDGAVFNYNVIYSSIGSSSGGGVINANLKCNPDTQDVSAIQNEDGNLENVCKNKESGKIEDPIFCEEGSKAETIDGLSTCVDIETGEETEPKKDEPKDEPCEGLETFEYLICLGKEVLKGDQDKEKDETLDDGTTSDDENADGDPGTTIICDEKIFLCASAFDGIIKELQGLQTAQEFNDMLYILAGIIIVVTLIALAIKRKNPVRIIRGY